MRSRRSYLSQDIDVEVKLRVNIYTYVDDPSEFGQNSTSNKKVLLRSSLVW